MTRRLPNLNAVRAFDAAARHQSFSRAADELAVTHAAVSRHVRGLEAQLGVALFERRHRQVALTPAGQGYAKRAQEALETLSLDRADLAPAAAPEVTIDVDSAFAHLWLLPEIVRAGDLGVSLDVRSQAEPPKRLAADADLAVTWGQVDAPGFVSERLLDFQVFPVCAPALAERLADGGWPARLETRLIHDRGWQWWRELLRPDGRQPEAFAGHLTVHRSYLAMEAAARGLGLATGDDVSAGEMLRDGRLVRPWATVVPGRMTYRLCVPDTRPLSPAVARTADWLRARARAHRAWRDAALGVR
jgi:LysR family glycine cleavage system transcriptional activator